MRNSGKPDRNAEPNSKTKGGGSRGKLEDDVDALFKLPLAEFTGARNALAAELKKSGRGDDAVQVKAWAKPSVSAWVVNQLYWNHRDAFDQLIASGERFHKAQASPVAGKLANLRSALDARREALTQLSHLASSLLRDAGHNPSPDTVHRITTTLEAMSVYASRSDAPRPGRLTHDVDPPGFDSFASFVPSAAVKQPAKEPARSPQKSISAPTNVGRKVKPDDDVRQREEAHKTGIAAAKVSLQEAKRTLTKALARAQSLGVTQKRVSAEAKKADKLRRDAEERLEKARVVAERAARLAQSVAGDVKEAEAAVEDAQRTVETASEELESLLRAGR